MDDRPRLYEISEDNIPSLGLIAMDTAQKNDIAILGSTGSIGRQTVEVAQHLGLRVAVLAAAKSTELLEQQARLLRPALVAVTDEHAASSLRTALADRKSVV